MVTSVTKLASLVQGVGVGVGVIVGVDVVVAVHVGVEVAVAVRVDVGTGVSVGVANGVCVGVSVGVTACVGVPVEGSGVKVPVGDDRTIVDVTVNCDVSVRDAESPASFVMDTVGVYVAVGCTGVSVKMGVAVLPTGDGETNGVAVGRGSVGVKLGAGEDVCVTNRAAKEVGVTSVSWRRGLYHHTAPEPATTKQPTSKTISKRRSPSPWPRVLRSRDGSASKSP